MSPRLFRYRARQSPPNAQLARRKGPPYRMCSTWKLEYAEDVGVLDDTSTEASKRLTRLYTAAENERGLKATVLKSFGQHVLKAKMLSTTIEEVVEAMDFKFCTMTAAQNFRLAARSAHAASCTASKEICICHPYVGWRRRIRLPSRHAVENEQQEANAYLR